MSGISFIIAATAHGTMIVPRNDYQLSPGSNDVGYGVGWCLLNHGHHELELDVPIMIAAVEMARRERGDGVVVIDGGANIGTVTLSLAGHMQGWGGVIAFEPQDRIFMALCGNVVINNLFNVNTLRAALSNENGTIDFPVPDYSQPGNYGGVSAVGDPDFGQKVTLRVAVPTRTIDSLELPRLDLLKLDLEGMEMEALEGARKTIDRCKPVMCIEHIKVTPPVLEKFYQSIGYKWEFAGINMIGAPEGHKIIHHLHQAWEKKRAA